MRHARKGLSANAESAIGYIVVPDAESRITEQALGPHGGRYDHIRAAGYRAEEE